MWRSFDRQHCGPICAVRGAVPFVVLAAVTIICLSGFLSDAQSEEEQLSKTGEIDHQIIIREHAGWNMECAAIAHPALYLNKSPDHGRVCHASKTSKYIPSMLARSRNALDASSAVFS